MALQMHLLDACIHFILFVDISEDRLLKILFVEQFRLNIAKYVNSQLTH